MAYGKKLTIYMINGNEYGPRTAEIGNWTGKAVYSPRVNVEDLFCRDEMSKPAVYVLKSYSESDRYIERIYIGQSNNLGNRIRQHIDNDKDMWVEMIAFVSKDDLLTQSQITYLESRLIALTRDADVAEISNGQCPKVPLLSEPDSADMEYFLEQMKMILPLMGFRFLIKKEGASTFVKITEEHPKTFYLKRDEFEARMVITDEGYVILKGSTANKKVGENYSWRKRRESLIRTGLLVDIGTHFEFTADVLFNSPSAAGAIVVGTHLNGLTAWKEVESNLTLKDITRQV